ncbi:MAG: hypothetical protein AAF202_10000 [Pseudomonadota bacterium]
MKKVGFSILVCLLASCSVSVAQISEITKDGGVGVGNGDFFVGVNDVKGRVSLGFFESREDYVDSFHDYVGWVNSGGDSVITKQIENQHCDMFPEFHGGYIEQHYRPRANNSIYDLEPGVMGYADVILRNCSERAFSGFGEALTYAPF